MANRKGKISWFLALTSSSILDSHDVPKLNVVFNHHDIIFLAMRISEITALNLIYDRY